MIEIPMTSVIFICGCRPWMRFLHPWMTLTNMDEVPPSMDGTVLCQILFMYYKVFGQSWPILVIYRNYAIHSRTIFSNFSLFNATMFQGRLSFKGDYLLKIQFFKVKTYIQNFILEALIAQNL